MSRTARAQTAQPSATTASRAKVAGVLCAVAAAALLHAAAPAGPHGWHLIHLVAAKLYYVPLLLAAAWLDLRLTIAVAALVTSLSLAHTSADWAGWRMVQAEQAAETATFWVVAGLGWMLFRRERSAREAVRAGHEETLALLVSSLELRERETGGHSRRVRDYALLLADEMGLVAAAFREDLTRGALLHDIGKIGLPDAILLKPGALDRAEAAAMRSHPALGAALAGDREWLRGAREVILAHHERWDGDGYPLGLRRTGIPLAARVFAVADAFDAMTSDRPYHRGRSWEEAAWSVAEARSSHFDPDVADAFLRVPFEAWARAAARGGVSLRRCPGWEERPVEMTEGCA